jgi:hypothetical protein
MNTHDIAGTFDLLDPETGHVLDWKVKVDGRTGEVKFFDTVPSGRLPGCPWSRPERRKR